MDTREGTETAGGIAECKDVFSLVQCKKTTEEDPVHVVNAGLTTIPLVDEEETARTRKGENW